MARKGNGEGTIYYSEKLNKWVGQFTAGRKENGKLNRKSVYGNTRKEVKEKMIEAQAKVQSNSYIEKSEITIGELGKNIIEDKYAANIISGNTYNRDLGTFKHIDDIIGDVPIQKITPEQIQSFLNSKKDYAQSTIQKFNEMLNRIFQEAIKRDIITKNPLSLIIKPKSTKRTKTVDSLTIEEQKLFIEEVENDCYKNILLLALHSGMRVGEILALTPEDIDFKNNLIHITKTLTRNEKGQLIVGKTTKTYESTRDIPITKILEPILKNSLIEYAPNKNNLIYILKENKKIIEPSTINDHCKKVAKNAGIRVIIHPTNKKGTMVNLKRSTVNTHMLRHTYATRCIEAGVPAEVLQKLLGHKDISITINTYTTIFDKYKKDSLESYITYIQNL